MTTRSEVGLVLLLVAVLLTPDGAFARTEGSLAGVVTDGLGQPLAGVNVTVGSVSLLGQSRTTRSDAHGRYRFPALPPGIYRLTIAHPGFEPFDVSGLQVLISWSSIFDPVLEMRNVEVTIEVSDQVRILAPRETQAETTLDNAFVDKLPVIGRAYQLLVRTVPGVVSQEEGGLFGPENVNSHGARSTDNMHMLDGATSRDVELGIHSLHFNADAVDQMEIITAALDAEHGGVDGAIVNFVTKSGGNEVSGSLAAYSIPQELDKRGSGKQEVQGLDFHRRFYSATLGGPFVKDRLWYFTSFYYEDRLDVVQYQEQAPYSVQQRPTEIYDLFGKSTWRVSDNHQLIADVFAYKSIWHNTFGAKIAMDRYSQLLPGNEYRPPSARFQTKWSGEMYLLKETAILSPNVLLESLAAHGEFETYLEPDEDAPPTDLPYNGFDRTKGEYVGKATRRGQSRHERSQFKEDLSIYVDDVLGQHEIQIGLEYQLNMASREHNIQDEYVLENGVPVEKWWTSVDPHYAPREALHTRTWSFYAQDHWTPTPRLHLALGVRADHMTAEANSLTGGERILTDPEFTPGDRRLGMLEQSGYGIAPRLALSWDPWGDGRNLIRASASRYYILPVTAPGLRVGASYIGWYHTSFCETDALGNCIQDERSGRFDTFLDYPGVAYTDEATLSFEREVIPEMAIGLTAVYRRSHRLLRVIEQNYYYTDDDGDGFPETERRRNPNFKTIYGMGGYDRANHRGLELSLRKRLSHRWQLLASWTYSKTQGHGAWTYNWINENRTDPHPYRNLEYDRRQMVKADAVCMLPGSVVLGASARYLTGTPYSIRLESFNDLNRNGYPDVGESQPIYGLECFGDCFSQRNDDYFNLDLHGEKSFQIDGVTLGVMVEVFNLLNDQSIADTEAWMDPYDPDCTENCTVPFPGYVRKTETRRFGRRFQLGFRISF